MKRFYEKKQECPGVKGHKIFPDEAFTKLRPLAELIIRLSPAVISTKLLVFKKSREIEQLSSVLKIKGRYIYVGPGSYFSED